MRVALTQKTNVGIQASNQHTPQLAAGMLIDYSMRRR